LRVRGPKSKIEETFSSFCHGELMGKKWLDSIEKQKEAMFVTNRQTDGQTDRVNDKKNNRLLA